MVTVKGKYCECYFVGRGRGTTDSEKRRGRVDRQVHLL